MRAGARLRLSVGPGQKRKLWYPATSPRCGNSQNPNSTMCCVRNPKGRWRREKQKVSTVVTESCPGSHFDAKRACSTGTCPLLAFRVTSRPWVQSKGSRSPTGQEEARRNGLELAPSPSRDLLRDQKFWIMPACFYILRLKSGNLYVGSTTDLEERYEDHCRGRACRTTTLDPPVALVYSEEYETFSQARRREAQVKHWSRAKKEALVSGDLAVLRNLSRSRTK